MKPAVLHPALPARRSFYIAWVVLVIGLLITAAVTLYMKSDVERIAEQEFIAECRDIQEKIAARLDDHARILRSGAALFKISDTVTRDKWRIFIERQQVQKELPGIQGIGFSLLIPRAELARHTQGIRKE
ncbi:MAG: CHASE domain-containing protein, partial [Syntrophales bacterium]